MPLPRNPVVRAGAILRKGGVHRQSASGHRHQSRRSLEDELNDWYAEQHESVDEQLTDEQGSDATKSRQTNRGRSSAPDGLAWLIHLQRSGFNARFYAS
jgi:hypothetical protein